MTIEDRILQGKIQYIKRASLDVVFSFGNIVNHTIWQPADQDFFTDLQVEIYLDDQLLLKQCSDDQVHRFHYEFEDSSSTVDRELRIGCSGFLPKHFPVFEIVPMLYIQSVHIEGLNMERAIIDHGRAVYYDDPGLDRSAYPRIGHNGYQSLKFTTPIYAWLLDNEKEQGYYENQ